MTRLLAILAAAALSGCVAVPRWNPNDGTLESFSLRLGAPAASVARFGASALPPPLDALVMRAVDSLSEPPPEDEPDWGLIVGASLSALGLGRWSGERVGWDDHAKEAQASKAKR